MQQICNIASVNIVSDALHALQVRQGHLGSILESILESFCRFKAGVGITSVKYLTVLATAP